MLRASLHDVRVVGMTDLPSTTHKEPRPKKIRSAVTNGNRRFVDGDGRSAWDRRRRDIEAEYLQDMGGRDSLSGYQRALAQVAATLRVELEALEGRLSKAEPVDLDGYARVGGHFRRICETLGIERRAKDVTPTLAEIISRHRADEARKAVE
jgi:hypothetical protein